MDDETHQHAGPDVPPIPVKREFVAEYVHGMGNNIYLIRARSAREIVDRYPLFRVVEIDDDTGLAASDLETMRMYPGPGRARDIAVKHRNPEERRQFLRTQEELWARASRLSSEWGLSVDTSAPDMSRSQRWVDIDDDSDFRVKMHDYWRDDPRYRELPPEKRLA